MIREIVREKKKGNLGSGDWVLDSDEHTITRYPPHLLHVCDRFLLRTFYDYVKVVAMVRNEEKPWISRDYLKCTGCRR